MPLLECRDLYRDYAGTVVLESVSLAIQPGDRIGLVGPNGAGKTTLLNALAGVDDDFRGSRIAAPGLRIGYLTQHVEPQGDQTALDYLLADHTRAAAALRVAEESLSVAGPAGLATAMKRYEAALEKFEVLGGDFAVERAGRALALVGLPGREGVRAAALSGGERGTLALARVLQGNPQLLILDEPGNHLDFWGMAWLEDFLVNLKSALLVVSHNRMLLDKVVGRIVELEQGRVKEYSGDYSAYRLEKLRNAATQGAEWQASRKKIARLEAMVERCAVMAAAFTKRQVKSNGSLGQKLRARRRQLEREKSWAVERPELGATAITAAFSGRGAAEVKSDYALLVDGYSRAWGSLELYRDASFEIGRGERVALVGPNGCGKTTFLRDLVDRHDWQNGPLRLCPSMRLGYVAQDRDGFRRGRSVRGEFADLGARENDIRNLLRDFGFGRGDPDRAIDTLSGGELNRLQLARAIWTGANFLVLDEPTNHLDIDARESVEDALAEYDGTLLIVSHDRYFIEKLATRIVELENGKALLERRIKQAVSERDFALGRRLANELQATLVDIERLYAAWGA
ncbi:MAG: hypothetical protein A2087_01160 [Spirochaetes bacterium GWD1_61_31]|nr:MAG: hypothetical protein A2087_01160 [Spirochaetes bacterium GWD1_61_31]OHD44161.1 MAG: hypothetical protein A2Y35_08790 [Spirochaetes bacterium GWE1_60_18]